MNNESTESLRTKLHTRTTRALNHANNELNDKTIDQICHCLKRSETILYMVLAHLCSCYRLIPKVIKNRS